MFTMGDREDTGSRSLDKQVQWKMAKRLPRTSQFIVHIQVVGGRVCWVILGTGGGGEIGFAVQCSFIYVSEPIPPFLYLSSVHQVLLYPSLGGDGHYPPGADAVSAPGDNES
jgi:hypothetical protein